MSENADVVIREDAGKFRTPNGHAFFKTWTPENAAAARNAPILLFHDSLGCVDLWREFPGILARATDRSVVAYDRVGFGRSDPHPGRLGADFIAKEAQRVVPRLCEDLGLTTFIACGHSVGGAMAVETAARFQDQCQALVTIAAQAFVEDRTIKGIQAARETFRTPDGIARLAKYHGSKAGWVVDAWIDTWLAPEFRQWNLDHALPSVRCPVLALHGDSDEYGSPEHARRIAEGRGTARILPNMGHLLHRENPTLVSDLVRQFLKP